MRIFRKKTRQEEQKKYNEGVAKRLNEVFGEAEDRVLDPDTQPAVLLSDLHRGSRDGADDFWRCERAYHAALGYYLDAGYTLFALGDVDELWECWPRQVIKKYPETMKLEAEFLKKGRYVRLWGNHDDLWSDDKKVTEHLSGPKRPYPPGLKVHEAVKLQLRNENGKLGTLFLVHGHQGTPDSDHHSKKSRLFVRYVWRPIQRVLKRSRNTPAKDFRLRSRHDKAMYEWARSRSDDVILVAGHTHRPVFVESEEIRSIDDIERDIEKRRKRGGVDEKLPSDNAALELERAGRRWRVPTTAPPPIPCYFNTGCCAFADGRITALEIAGGEIRLVRWLNDKDEASAQRVSSEGIKLAELFDDVVNDRARSNGARTERRIEPPIPTGVGRA